MRGSNKIDTINNSDIYDTYKDLYLSEKEGEKKLLQGIQLAYGSKAKVGAKKADGAAPTVTTPEMLLNRRLINGLQCRWILTFFKHPVYPYGLKENLIVRLELNSSEEVILCTGDTYAKYKLSDISLEYDAIFDEPYARAIGEMYAGTSIPHTNVTSIHHETLSKKTYLED